jgi:tetratricopeptide (TPR) repeat protein
MRAMNEVGHLLYFSKQYDQACGIFEEMLKLNPGDNQGIRNPLLGCLFLASKIDGVRKVLMMFADEDSAMMNWARVLERLVSLDEPGASKLLKKAMRQNKHVAPILLLQKEPPPAMGGYSPGLESEAREVLLNLGMAWNQHSIAFLWLGQQCGVKIIQKPKY